MLTGKELGAAIEAARIAKGVNKKQLAEAFGVKPPSVQGWVNTGRIDKSKLMELIAYFADTVGPEHWGITGRVSDAIARGNAEGGERPVTEAAPEYLGMSPISVWDDETPLDEDEVEVPFLREVELAAGSGRTAIQESAGFKLRFGKRSLRRQGVQPENAVCVTISGNSMEPVLRSGATVGVDRGKKDVVDGDLYAINHGGQLRVKQVYRLPGGGIRLHSFNLIDHPDESYPLEAMQEHGIEIIGRVFWGAMFF